MVSAIFRHLMLLGALAICGCSTLPPDDGRIAPAFPDDLLEQNPELSERTRDFDASERERLAHVNALLQQPLSPSRVTELLLIHSPGVRVQLADLGLAEAQHLQASLISNPTLAVGALRPQGGGRWQWDAGISQSILDLFTLPLRRRLASAEYNAAQLRLSEELAQLIHAAQNSYLQAVAQHQLAALLATRRQAAAANLSLAHSLHAAGNIPERNLLQYQLEDYALARQEQDARLKARQASISLGNILGLDSSTHILLPEALASLPERDNFSAAKLFEVALQKRSDLRLAREQLRSTEFQLALQQDKGVFTELDLGLNYERESDGSYAVGPEISLSLPVFDRGYARLQAASADVAHAREALRMRTIATETSIANAFLALGNARTLAEQIQQQALPLQRKLQALSLREYNFMLTSAFELIQLKQAELDLQREYVEALLAYWQARSDLALMSGQALVVEYSTTPEHSETTEYSNHHHGDHDHD